jgi:hypothetical protein
MAERVAEKVRDRDLDPLAIDRHRLELGRLRDELELAGLKMRKAGAIPPGAPTFEVSAGLIAGGYTLIDALVQSGLCKSKGEAS